MADKVTAAEVQEALIRVEAGTASPRDKRIRLFYMERLHKMSSANGFNRWLASCGIRESDVADPIEPNVGEQAVLDFMRGPLRANYVERPVWDATGANYMPPGTSLPRFPSTAATWTGTPLKPEAPEPTPSRPDVQEWALGLALAVSARADCTRRQVGAVILDPENRVISTGYNGYPAGAPGCLTEGACPRGRLSYTQVPADSPYVGTDAPCGALHAEENAVLYARRDLRGCVLYCTHKPCPNCERLLRGTGLASVVWAEGSLDLTA